MNHAVSKDEKLYRAISKQHVRENNKIAFTAFIDPRGGVSVDRDGDRNESTIIENLNKRFKKDITLIAKLTVIQCLSCDTVAVLTPSKNNKYHAEIHSSNEIVILPREKARKLCACCSIIKTSATQI